MNTEERKQKALDNIKKMKADIAQAVADSKKAVAKAKRDAKKPPKPSKATFGSIDMLHVVYDTGNYVGFIYSIEICNKIYIGKKLFGSEPKWTNYKSSSKHVQKLIKRAVEMGATPIYKAISYEPDQIALQRAEIAQIRLHWSLLLSQGRLDDSLNIDDGSGHLHRDEWRDEYADLKFFGK